MYRPLQCKQLSFHFSLYFERSPLVPNIRSLGSYAKGDPPILLASLVPMEPKEVMLR
jgi:hypothetical protein